MRALRALFSPDRGRITFRILVPLLLAMAALVAAFALTLHHTQSGQSALALRRSAAEVQHLLQAGQEQKARIMATTLEAMMGDERLADLYAARDRDAAITRLTPLFASLRGQHHVSHLYIHGPDRINWLRMHRLAESGDFIDRFTIREAERTGKISSGLERGPVGKFVLRTVAPWRKDGRLLGYLELGVEFEDVVEEVRGLLSIDLVAAVYKRFLDKEQWNTAQKHYGQLGSWDDFPTTVVTNMTMKTLPVSVSAYLSALPASGRGVDRLDSWDGRDFQVGFLPLINATGETLGELIFLQDVSAEMEQTRASIRFVTLACLAVSGILAGLFYLFLSRVEKDLAHRTTKLETEIVERQRAERELSRAHAGLEQRVADRTRELQEANTGLSAEIASKERARKELKLAQGRLIEASRRAGMAEVATGVLHNVGNVLNSVNVSATVVTDLIRRSKAAKVVKLRDLLEQNRERLGPYLTEDPKGSMIPAYLSNIADALVLERETIVSELESLQSNIAHIKDIVAMQQNYAKTSGVVETASAPDLIEGALRMNAGFLARHDVNIVRDYDGRPVITVEKNKVLQILVNLIRNAEHACDESGRADKTVTLRLRTDSAGVEISVIDTGVGIPAENLTRIFAHGFTTRKNGHGFGLHSGALAAKELGGSLSASSAGPGLGASFALRLPLAPS